MEVKEHDSATRGLHLPGQYNDVFYTAPAGWSKGNAPSSADICPACAKLLAVKHGNSRSPAVSTVLFKDTPAVIPDSLTQSFAQRLQGSLGENLRGVLPELRRE